MNNGMGNGMGNPMGNPMGNGMGNDMGMPMGGMAMGMQNRSPPPQQSQPMINDGRAQPPPIGQAVELDASTGLASPTFRDFNVRDSDSDVAGMIALQQRMGDEEPQE